jgi:hypothetical protein
MASHKALWIVCLGFALLANAPRTMGEDAPVSRAEFDRLVAKMSAMQAEIDRLKAEKNQAPAESTTSKSTSESGSKNGGNSKSLADLNSRVENLEKAAQLTEPGENKFVLTGNMSATFTTVNNGSSNFDATFYPIFLWHLTDNLLFEGEIEFELDGNSTSTSLEYAALDWTINDNLTLVAGKFLSPMNTFVERYNPKWINKLPDAPLTVYDGILPESNVGVELRGMVPLGQEARINYAAYVSNTPDLITTDPSNLGHLEFDNFSSSGHGKAFGARVGFAPWRNLEVGYGFQRSKVPTDTGDGPGVDTTQQSVDLSAHLDALGGRWTLLSQYAWSRIGHTTLDPDGSLGIGPLGFTNNSDGGYVQLSYRALTLGSDFLNKMEFIVRGDRLHAAAGDPNTVNERRLTLGIDYWLTSSTVLKAAYELDHQEGNGNSNAVLLGIATSF